MCSPDWTMFGVNTAMGYLGQRASAKGQQEYMNAMAKASFTEMNYNLQDLEQQRSDAFDSALNEMIETRLSAMVLESGVKASVNETMSGRTADLIIRDSQADTSRAIESIKDNYIRNNNEIDLNRERVVLNTKSKLVNLNNSAPKMPSRLSNFLEIGAGALSAHTGTMNRRNTVKVENSRPKMQYGVYSDPTYSKTFQSTKGFNWEQWLNEKKRSRGITF